MKKILFAAAIFCILASVNAQQPSNKQRPSGKAIEAKKCKKEKVPFAPAKRADKASTEQKTVKLHKETFTVR